MFLELCNNVGALKVIMFMKILLNIAFTVIPVILIIMLMIDFSKNAIASDEGEQKKTAKLAIKRVVMAVLLFSTQFIVTFVMNTLGDLGVDWSSCYNMATEEGINEVAINNAESLITELGTDDGLTYANLQSLEDAILDVPDSTKAKEYEEILEKYQEQYNIKNDNSNDDKDDDDDGRNDSTEYYTYFVGDSRTVGMCNNVRVAQTEDCSIAKGSMGYNWFKNTALSSIKSALSEKPNSAIVINMGTNDLLTPSAPENYATLYNQLANDYPDSRIIAVSVTPIEDKKAGGYAVRDKDVITFNSALKPKLSSNVEYCDAYSSIKDNFSTGDGVHYDASTYNKIYNYIKKCL